MKLQKPKGTQDILPGDSAKWQYVEGFARKVFARYNYDEIRTPIFEHYEVISRSVGDTTDIVTKEMYDFYDKGDRHITLRPEGTAPVVRSYVENKLLLLKCKSLLKSTIWALCSAMSGLRLDVCGSFTRLVQNALDLAILLQM